MNNTQPFISSTQPILNQNNHPFTGNSSIPPPYAYHQNTNTQLNLPSEQSLNGSQAEADPTPSNFTISVKTEPINPLLVSEPKIKQEPSPQPYLLNSQVHQQSNPAPTSTNLNLNLVEKSEQQRELNTLLENLQETWKHQLNPSLLKKAAQIHSYCSQKTSKIVNSIDILLNNRILPIISLLTQANLKREGLELVIQNLAKFVGSYRILVWIRDLVDASETELKKVFNAGEQLNTR
jgi:Glu-tRNA(Gln) amidotransferase subunit E-like FAD-binding protein